jgi:N-acyl-D-amino-acid deacylase
MTSLPANTFRLTDRGQIHEGFAADIVIFDAKKVRDNATFTHPHQYATGFEYVVVNGDLAVENGKLTGRKPGRALRMRH